MMEPLGTTGLILNEPLLWEKGAPGRTGISLPRRDVDPAPLDASLAGEGPDFPDLSEVDVVRHYTRLSTWNYGVDTGFYPLGSCTMKYNPKTNERQAGLPGFAGAHPLLPLESSQGVLRLMFELERFLGEITGNRVVTATTATGVTPGTFFNVVFRQIENSLSPNRDRRVNVANRGKSVAGAAPQLVFHPRHSTRLSPVPPHRQVLCLNKIGPGFAAKMWQHFLRRYKPPAIFEFLTRIGAIYRITDGLCEGGN